MSRIRDILNDHPDRPPSHERPEPIPSRAVSDTFDALNRMVRANRPGSMFQVVYLGEGKVHVIPFIKDE